MFGPVVLTLSSFQGFIIFQFQTARYEMSCKFVEITVKTTLPVKVFAFERKWPWVTVDEVFDDFYEK